MCKESCNTLDIHIAHYIIGLNVLGALHQPCLHMCTWCCFGCCGKHIHIPWGDQSIGSTLDEEKWSWRNTCHDVHRAYCIKVDTVEHVHRYHDPWNDRTGHETISFKQRHKGSVR